MLLLLGNWDIGLISLIKMKLELIELDCCFLINWSKMCLVRHLGANKVQYNFEAKSKQLTP